MVNSISRRRFAGVAAGAIVPLLTPAWTFANHPGPAKALRVIAYNIYGGNGWPKERPLARQAVEKKQMTSIFG